MNKLKDKLLIKNNEKNICCIIIFISFLLKMFYSYMVSFGISPHDLGLISDWSQITTGHLGYIQYLYQVKHLPDFSPIGMGQFYHPPLFHTIGAVVLKLSEILNRDLYGAFENLQTLNMVFAVISTVYSYKIFSQLNIKGTTLIFLTVFVAFHPMFYILGVTLNNDCLMSMFCIASIYYTIRWYKEQKIGNIIKIAFALSLGMITKTSAGLIAPAIAVVFLYTLIKNKSNWKSLLLQFVVFGVICVPIGLSWCVRNKLLFDVPFNYVINLGENSNQYIGNLSLWDRIGIPNVAQLTATHIDWNNMKAFSNIWGQTILTMVVDEGILNIDFWLEAILTVLLIWISCVLYLLCLYSVIKLAFKRKYDLGIKLLLCIGYFTLMISYVSFCFGYPHICTMNFRYITATVPVLAACFGIIAKGRLKIVGNTLMMLSAILTGILYFITVL